MSKIKKSAWKRGGFIFTSATNKSVLPLIFIRRKSVAVIFLFALGCCIGGCNAPALHDYNELVMCHGMEINAVGNPNINITYIDKLTRRYKLDNIDVTVRLIPRKERWYGGLGLYKPTGTSNLHMVLEEGQQHFVSKHEAIEWLELQKIAASKWKNIRYTADGLVVVWSHPKEALQVDVWQIYVQGSKPLDLPGSTSSELVKYLPSYNSSHCVDVGQPITSKPKVIAGTLFSGLALDLIRERGVTPSDAIQIIMTGHGEKVGAYMVYMNKDPFGKPFSVIVDSKGAVVSIT